MEPDKKGGMDAAVLGEVQLILAEKRTSLASLRTGIAIFALPLSVLSLLVATSKYYQPSHVLQFLLPLLGLCAVLVVLGSYLVVQSIRHIRRYDQMIRQLKREYGAIAGFID